MTSQAYSPVNSARSWRSGRFAVTQFAADHQSPPIPSEHWGYLPFWLAFDPSHLELSCRVLPTGAFLIGNCPLCGGRLELPFPITSDGNALEPHDELAYDHALWAKTHISCSDTPQNHDLAPDEQEFLDRVLSTGRAVFERNGELETHLHILFKDGSARAIPIHDIPARGPLSEARDKMLAARLGNLGGWMKGRSQEAVISIVTGEAWGLPADTDGTPYLATSPDRDEYLMASFTTPTFGRIYAKKLTAADRSWSIPGLEKWHPVAPRSSLHDGIFAVADAQVGSDAGSEAGSLLPVSN